MISNLRLRIYKKLLHLPVPWFDKPSNDSATICTLLSIEISKAACVCKDNTHVVLLSISTIITGIVIAFVHEWRTALVGTALIPFMVVFGFFQLTLG